MVEMSGHLRADVEMDELEAMGQALGFEQFAGGDEIGGVESELGVLPAARGPFARAFAMQSDTDADVGLDSHLSRHADGLLQFLDLLDHDDDRFAEPAPEHGGANVGAVLVAVADDEALHILMHGERGDQLGLRAGFEAEMVFLSGIHDLFDHFAELVDFDWENAAVFVLVTEFAHRALEGAVDGGDAVPEQILEANDEREAEPALTRFLHHFEDIDRSPAFLQRADLGVSGGVDREIAGAPAINIVGRDCRLDIPICFRFFGHGSQRNAHNQSPRGTCKRPP